ncbi:hypothetical protein BD769DRAFT_1395850 [Suillus cothurnatus]|nr:hypothetical protein BD769DRAFT_1395850 [Suillus cothurnatus]
MTEYPSQGFSVVMSRGHTMVFQMTTVWRETNQERRVHTPPIILSPEDIVSQVMSRPAQWMDIVENIPMLSVNTWLYCQVTNYYLALAWYNMLGRVKVRFVDMFAARGTTQWTDEELELFRINHFVGDTHILSRFMSTNGIAVAADGGKKIQMTGMPGIGLSIGKALQHSMVGGQDALMMFKSLPKIGYKMVLTAVQ